MSGDTGRPAAAGDTLDLTIARLLTIGTYASVALLAAGVVLMALAGRSPLDGGPAFDAGRVIPDIAALRPEGVLWLGLLAAIATPSARVAAALIGYLRSSQRAMAAISAAVLGIIALSVILAVGTET